MKRRGEATATNPRRSPAAYLSYVSKYASLGASSATTSALEQGGHSDGALILAVTDIIRGLGGLSRLQQPGRRVAKLLDVKL